MTELTRPYLVALAAAGWTPKSRTIMALANDAGVSAEFSGYLDEAAFVAALYLRIGEQQPEVYGIFFAPEDLDEVIELVDAGVRAATPADHESWLYELVERDYQVIRERDGRRTSL